MQADSGAGRRARRVRPDRRRDGPELGGWSCCCADRNES